MSISSTPQARHDPSDVDKQIARILLVGEPGNHFSRAFGEDEIISLCLDAKQSFAAQPTLLDILPPVKVCGDTHGQYADLLRLFERGGFPPMANYLFLGDYVDRGQQGLETICLLFSYKIRYPANFFLLRGNHECAVINKAYGFYEECNRRYQSVRLWNTFQEVFTQMPLTALIAGRILCMHGGISRTIKSLDQLRTLPRMADPMSSQPHTDLLWSDPDSTIRGFKENQRGVSCVFGEDVLTQFCNRLELDLIARAHQVVQDGYEFFGSRKLVTIFSAPFYCGQFDNASAFMNVDEALCCSFTVLRPQLPSVKKAV